MAEYSLKILASEEKATTDDYNQGREILSDNPL